VGTLGHIFEAAGLATVGISSIRGQTERLRPPRALYCEFPLGRPLGRPGDPRFQHRVLRAALDLLARPAGPVLEDFPDTIEASTTETLSCSVPPRLDLTLPVAVDEAVAFRPAYERQLKATGRTTVGRALNADTIPTAVHGFVRIADGSGLADAALPANPTDCALDIRSYYEEAALAIAAHVPAARATQEWFYEHTAAGGVIKAAQAQLKQAGVDRDIWMFLAPFLAKS
jgi:hypothetical protein